jgi:hypothetical protein
MIHLRIPYQTILQVTLSICRIVFGRDMHHNTAKKQIGTKSKNKNRTLSIIPIKNNNMIQIPYEYM